MRIVVSGASGFVGKGLQELLSRQNLSANPWVIYYLTTKKKRDFEYQEDNKWITITNEVDVIQKVMRDLKPDIFVNLAWKGIPDYSLDNSVANIFLNSIMINAAYEAGARRVITTGSCWEYLNPNGIIAESHSLDEGNYFKVAKNSVRKFGNLISKQFEAEFVWLRLFYVYGRFQNQHSLLPSLIYQGVNGQCPTAKNLAAKLDFVSVEFVAEVIIELIKAETLDQNIYNVGTGERTAITDIVNTVRKYFGYQNFEKEPPKYLQDFAADTSRIKKLNLEKKPSLLQIVPKIIEEMKL